MPRKSNNSLGLALGSGGARGLTHIGVLRGLKKAGIRVDLITGTSIGAVVGAMYAATLDPDWIQTRISEFLNSDEYHEIGLERIQPTDQPNPSIFQSAAKYVRQRIYFNIVIDRMGLLKSERLRSVIEFMLPVKTFEELQLPFGCVAVDLNSGADVAFNSGDLITALTASSTVPGYIEPVRLENYLLTDGGISQPMPLKLLKNMGAKTTLAVDVSIDSFQQLKSPNLMQILGRAEQISSSKLAQLTDARADVLIKPDNLNLFWSDFTQIEKLVDNGENAVCNHLEEIQSKMDTKLNISQRLLKQIENYIN